LYSIQNSHRQAIDTFPISLDRPIDVTAAHQLKMSQQNPFDIDYDFTISSCSIDPSLYPVPSYELTVQALQEANEVFHAPSTFVPPGFSTQQQLEAELLQPAFPAVTTQSYAPFDSGASASTSKKRSDAVQPPRKRGRPPKAKGPLAQTLDPQAPLPLAINDSTALLQLSQNTIEGFRRATTTTQAYARHVRTFERWLNDYQANRKEEDPDLDGALNTLSEKTAMALQLFFSWRSLSVAYGTIEAARSALKALFHRKFPQDGCVSAARLRCTQL
jgi:hypothetical protein